MAKGYTTVSVPKVIYRQVEDYYQRNEYEMQRRRIRSISQLFVDAAIEFMYRHDDETLEKEQTYIFWKIDELQQKIISEDKKSRKMPQKI